MPSDLAGLISQDETPGQDTEEGEDNSFPHRTCRGWSHSKVFVAEPGATSILIGQSIDILVSGARYLQGRRSLGRPII